MSLPEVLGHKDPADFRSRQYNLLRTPNLVRIEEVGEELTFAQMSLLRAQGMRTPEDMQSALDSAGAVGLRPSNRTVS